MRKCHGVGFLLIVSVSLLCVLNCWSQLLAQEGTQKPPAPGALPPEDTKVDVPAAKGVPLKLVIQSIREQLEKQVGQAVNITAAKELEEKEVKKLLTGVGWKKALEDIAEYIGGQLTYPSDNWAKIVPMPKVTLTIREGDLGIVLDLLAVQSGKNIVVGPEVKGKVSFTLNNVSWKTAFDTVVKTMGFVAVQEAEDIIRVTTKERLEAQLETEIFTLRYLRPQDPYMAIFPVGTGATGKAAGRTRERFVASSPKVSEGKGIEEFTLLKVLRNALTPQIGRLEYNWDTNQIIVTDVKPKLEEMRRMIKELDTAPAQVSIDIKFIRTTSSDLFEKGIRLYKPSVPASQGLDVSAYFPAPTSTSPEGTYRFDLGRWSKFHEEFGAVGVLDLTQTQIMLRLLKADNNSRVIQAPSVMTMDSHEAIIFVGETVPFVRQQANVDQAGNVTVTIMEDESSPISVGFTLFIVPHVIRETGEIALTVIPKTNTLIGTSDSEHPGFEKFGLKLSATVETYLSLPRTLDQTIVTKMIVKDGSTAVVGGLLTEKKVEKEERVPFLSSLPVIGHIFRWKQNETIVENLIIFISPKLISTSEQHLSAAESQMKTMQEADYFFQKYKLNAASQLEEKLKKEREKFEAAKGAEKEKEPKKEGPGK